MTNSTPLSPAAQAVLNAFGNSLTTEQYATTGRIEIAIAAALRAAADALVANEYWDKYPAIYYRKKLLATADELEAQ